MKIAYAASILSKSTSAAIFKPGSLEDQKVKGLTKPVGRVAPAQSYIAPRNIMARFAGG